jgi:hypothetical protein
MLVFCIGMSCKLEDRYKYFRETFCIHFQDWYSNVICSRKEVADLSSSSSSSSSNEGGNMVKNYHQSPLSGHR